MIQLPLIISFCDARYKNVALNWVCCLKKIKIDNYLIITLDNDAETFLKKNNIKTKLIEGGNIPRRSGKGWRWRFEKIYEILRSEPAIIHSDLDAVWIKNPISKLNSKYDIIASCDTGGFPVESFSKWNFTMCMGWVYFKNNSFVKSVFDKILKSKKNFDDQEEFNLYFSRKIESSDIYTTMSDDKEFSFNGLNVCVLEQNTIYRGDYMNTAYVCHPLMKKQADCELQLKKRKLWIL